MTTMERKLNSEAEVLEKKAKELRREAKLIKVVKAIEYIKGVKGVAYSDIDSNGAWVRISLKSSTAGSFSGKKPYSFPAFGKQPIRKAKNDIARVLFPCHFEWGDQPKVKYISNGGHKVRDGYDGDYIDICVIL